MKRITFCILWTLISINVFSARTDFYVDGIGYRVISFSDILTCEISDGTTCTGDIVIPETITYQSKTINVIRIGDDAFKGALITSVKISKNITDIGRGAFSSCEKLKTATIPENCNMDDDAFRDCTSLTSIVLPNSCYSISDGTFYGCSSLKYVKANNITSIGSNAFAYCSSLNSITLPNVTYLGDGCFRSCESLKSIEAKKITYIGDYSFEFCKSLSSFKLNNSSMDIGIGAFYACNSLTSIEIPENSKIDTRAFADCTSLSSIVIHKNVKPVENAEGIFENCPITTLSTASPFLLNNTGTLNNNINKSILKKITLLEGYQFLYTISTPYPDGTTVVTQEGEKFGWYEMENMDELISLSSEPPSMLGSFSRNQYLYLKVTVPTEALAAYQQADVWKNFWNLQGGATTSINTPTVDANNNDTPIYDIGGRKVKETVKGQIYIKNGKKFIAR